MGSGMLSEFLDVQLTWAVTDLTTDAIFHEPEGRVAVHTRAVRHLLRLAIVTVRAECYGSVEGTRCGLIARGQIPPFRSEVVGKWRLEEVLAPADDIDVAG